MTHYDCIDRAIETGMPEFADKQNRQLVCGIGFEDCPYLSQTVITVVYNHNTPQRYVTEKHICNYEK